MGEIGRVCDTHGDRKAYIELWRKIEKERDHYKYLVLSGSTIRIRVDLRETGWSGTDWIGLAQDRDQWTALVYPAMSHPVRENIGEIM
jgi:hypothetical protein